MEAPRAKKLFEVISTNFWLTEGRFATVRRRSIDLSIIVSAVEKWCANKKEKGLACSVALGWTARRTTRLARRQMLTRLPLSIEINS